MAAADALYEIMTMMVKKGPLSEMIVDKEDNENASLETQDRGEDRPE